MLERLTKTPEYRVFSVITSARAVLTAAMSVGAEILGKYRTKPKLFKYQKIPNKDYTCAKFLTRQSLPLLSNGCRCVIAALARTRGPRPLPRAPNSSLNMSNITPRPVVRWAADCSTALTLGLHFLFAHNALHFPSYRYNVGMRLLRDGKLLNHYSFAREPCKLPG